MGKKLGIYIHVPFCRSKCEYCDFYSLTGGRTRELMDKYLDVVVKHIREAAPLAPDYEVDSIYFGGGTPTFFGADNLQRILGVLSRSFHLARDCEISFEANPDSALPPTLRKLRRTGFNRMSLGVQSDANETLKALGRPHTYEQAAQAVRNARDAGFDNISVDLMYGLPNQTRERWMQTLRNVLDLKPDHISCYGLKVEPGTRLYEYREGANLPSDDVQADMYLYAVETLENFGYGQYEISNFTREGMECRHNLKYWLGEEYLSFGPSAHSDFAGKRFAIVSDLEQYVEGILKKKTVLSECYPIALRERASEYLMLRLRTVVGINGEEYAKWFLLSFEPIERLLRFYAGQGFAIQEDGRWRLSPKGFLVSNQIIGALMEAQAQSEPLTRRGGAR